jgi:hypothetical protein
MNHPERSLRFSAQEARGGAEAVFGDRRSEMKFLFVGRRLRAT